MIQTRPGPPFLHAATRLRTVASILISEVEPDVRRLLAVMVTRLGHDAVVLERDVAVPPRGDLLLVEPASRQGLRHARVVRAFFPELPVVCLSSLPEDAGLAGHGRLRFLPKPFTLDGLQAVLEAALETTGSPV